MKALLLTTLIGLSTAVLAQNIPMYSVSPFDDLLRIEDTTSWTTTGTSWTLTSTTGTVNGCNGLAVQPCSGEFYVVYKSMGSRYLGILDTTTAVITEIGDLGDNVAGITFGNAYDELYAVTGDGASTPETLYEVDISTATMTFKATLGAGSDGEAIAVCPDNGDIYHWSGINGWMTGSNIFERIDAVTNAITPITPSGYDFDEVNGVAYIGGGQFVMNSFQDFSLIDTNGVAVDLGSSSDETIKGMAFPMRYAYFETNDSICPGDTATITALEGDAYEWFFDGVTTGLTTQSIEVADEGDYYCMVTIDSCEYPTNTVYLEVLNAPNVNITPSPNAYLCAPGDSVLLTGSMGGSSQWYMDGSELTGETSNTLWVFTTGGTYNMTKTNMNGCTDSAAVGTVVVEPPTLSISTPEGDTICVGDSLLLITTEGGDSYNWYVDGTIISGSNDDSIYVSSAGTYSVATLFGNCHDSTATGTNIVEKNCDVGLAGLQIEKTVTIYPNPSDGELFIHLDEIPNNFSFEIIGLDGKKHISKNEVPESKLIKIDISELVGGTYLLKMNFDDKEHIQKIRKK